MDDLFIYLIIATWIHVTILHWWEEANQLSEIRAIMGYLSTVILFLNMSFWWSNMEYLEYTLLFQYIFEISFSIAWIIMIHTRILHEIAFLLLVTSFYVQHSEYPPFYLIGMTVLSCTKSEKISKHLLFIPAYFHWMVMQQYKNPLVLLMINFGMGYFYYHHW